MENKAHWENVYATKAPAEVSWTQASPEPSLSLIRESGVAKDAAIIDIGGGDSLLVDCLLELGYSDVTVLDISATALERAKERLGTRADQVTWIVADINDFNPERNYALWHDRAAFHFLTQNADINRYREMVRKHVQETLVLGTFSVDGPKRCSGLDISQYDEATMSHLLTPEFTCQGTQRVDHVTPFDTVQNFLFAKFGRVD